MKYFLFFLFLTNSIFAQDFNKLDSNGLKDGVWKGIYPESKRPRYEGTFNHGKETGMFKFFDDTKAGTLIATREFSDKDNSCYTIFYNQNNKKVSEGKEVNKLYEGEWKYYHKDSPNIMTTENYVAGKLTGVRKVYYPSGKIAEETNYSNGLKNGLYKKYAENDIVLEESNYKNDQYNGEAIFRSTDNKIAAKGVFKDGKKINIWEITSNGKTIKKNMNYQAIKFNKKPIKPEPKQ